MSSLDSPVLPQGFAGFGALAAQADRQQEDAINAFISSARGGGPEPPAAQENPPAAAAIRPVGGATSRGQGAAVTLRSVAEANRCSLGVVEAFLAALGADLEDGLVDFMYCSAEDLAAAVSVFTVDGNHSSAMQRGQATRFIAAVHQLKRTATDLPSIVAGQGVGTQGAPKAPAPDPVVKRKYAEVIDQADERTFSDLSSAELAECRANHVTVTGAAPPDDSRPSSDQLSALAAKLQGKQAPYVDFAIFGPFGRRQSKLLRYTAQVFVNGQLQTRQLKGPEGFEQWRAAWRVYRASMIMLGAARPSTLDSYEEGIRQLCILFPRGWGTIATADEFQRSERWEIAHEQAGMNPPRGYDAECPWDSIILDSCYGNAGGTKNHWWETRVVLPLLQGASAGQASTTAGRLESSFLVPAFVGGGQSSGAPPPPPHGNPRNKTRAQRTRESKDKAYAAGMAAGGGTRQGGQDLAAARSKQICHAWNREGCAEPCPNGRRHACMTCGGPHKKDSCPNSKGKGKGKGKQAHY